MCRALVVAQLAERSLPTQQVRGSNPVIGKIYIEHFKSYLCFCGHIVPKTTIVVPFPVRFCLPNWTIKWWWSNGYLPCSPWTLGILVRIPLKSTVFIL